MPTQLEDKPKQIYDDENSPGNERWFSGKKADPEQVKGMEEAFNKDSAKAEDLPDGHPDKNALKENDSVNSAGSGGSIGSRIRRKLKGKQKLIVGGAIGTSIGGIMAVFGILGGPIQMVHLAQILGNASRPTDTMVRTRVGSMLRNSRVASTGDVGAGRVSFIGNRVFGNVQSQLSSIGVEFDRSTRTGKPDRIRINLDQHPRFQNNRTATPAQSRAAIAQHYGVNPSRVTLAAGPGAPASIDIRGLNTGAVRALIDTSLSPLEDGKIMRSMNKRVMAKYFNVPSLFRPFQRIQAERQNSYDTRVQRRAAEKERRQARQARLPAKYQQALTRLQSTINNNARRIAGFTVLQGMTCMAKGIYEDIPLLNYANVVVPSMLEATEKQSMGSRIQSADDLDLNQLNTTLETLTYDADFAIEELDGSDDLDDFEKEEMRAMDGMSIWSSRPLNALAYGSEGIGTDIDIGHQAAFGGSDFYNSLSFLDSWSTDVLCSAPAQVIGGVLGIATIVTPGVGWKTRALAAGGQSLVFARLMSIGRDLLLERFTENAIEGFSGPNGGSLMAYGARAGNNLNATSMGGVELSDIQVAALTNDALEREVKELEKKPFLARVFDPYDYRSLTGKAINSSGRGIEETSVEFIAILTNPIKNISKTFDSLNPKAYAENHTDTYDWGFPVYGIPPEILEDDRFENPYQNEASVVSILDLAEEYKEQLRLFEAGEIQLTPEQVEMMEEHIAYVNLMKSRVRTCFGASIEKQNDAWNSLRRDPINPVDPDYLDVDPVPCNDFSWDDNWTRFVLFVFDNSLITTLDCYEGGQTSCADLGLIGGAGAQSAQAAPLTDTSGNGFVGIDTSSQACPSGSTDIGTRLVPTGENLPSSITQTSIRLCSTPEIPDGMNVAITQQAINLINAARAEGVSLSGGSFRSSERQAELRIINGCPDVYTSPSSSCRVPTARPGSSMHEYGLAIDFNNCRTRSTACYQWLNNNASGYGLINLPSEPWHWSTTGR